MEGILMAYILGGFNHINIKECLIFDFLDQKFVHLASLNVARVNCGALSTFSYLWVFGGESDSGILNSIEGLNLNSGEQQFKEINVNNQLLLE